MPVNHDKHGSVAGLGVGTRCVIAVRVTASRVTLLDSWMPVHDVSARYVTRIDAPPAVVYATLMATDFGRPMIVRVLMGFRLLPGLLTSPRATWERLLRPSRSGRGSLANLEHSPFILLEQQPPRKS